MVTETIKNRPRICHSFSLFILTGILLLLAIACGGTTPTPIAAVQPPEITGPQVDASTPLKPGEEVGISIEVLKASGTTLTYTWKAEDGEILKGQGSPAITFRAPDEPGVYSVIVEVKWEGQSVEKSTSIKVEAEPTPIPTLAPPTDTPPPTPTPAPTHTDTPAPPETPTPTPTESPMPTFTPSPTMTETLRLEETTTPIPSPDTLVTILNVQNSDTVAQSLSLIGEYAPEVTDDLWIFVGPPGENRWPQSPNACLGESAFKLDGRWEVRIGLGGPNDVGRFFEISMTTANDQASSYLSQTLLTWCRNNNYPGLSKNELPAGLTEYPPITVRRGPGDSEPHLDSSNIELPGQVVLEGIADGDIVPQSFAVSGTYSAEVTDHIWVIVYAPDGRYYPQSKNACEGISTIQSNGFWESGINLGGAGDANKPFDIIVALVNEDVHTIFERRQEEGCRTGSFPGYLFIELPHGIDEKASVSVRRGE